MASTESKVQESKKLYEDLNSIFIKNPEINEIGFIISSKEYDGLENKPFILIENKLGISFQWMVKLYSYAFAYFSELKSAFENKMNDLPERHKQLLVNELLQATRNILLINAENATALNLRKEFIKLKYLKHKDEILLLNLIFTKHPKSGEGWAHRKWVLTDYFRKTGDYLDYEVELSVCKRVAEIYPKNYYAWTHRWWVLQHLSIDIILKDLEVIEDWVKRNISDYCGYHHRYLILTHLFNKCFNNNNNNGSTNEENSNEMKINKLWEDEFNFIHKIINLYPGHESSWSYKRVLTLFWLEIAQPIVFQRNISTTVPITSLQQEYQFVDSILEDTESSYYEQQKSFAQRYLLSIYELKLTKFKDSVDFSIDIDQVKNNYGIILEDLKVSFPNQLKVWENKSKKFVGK
ncbi:hypothetical protein ACTA71_011408 [Dictyostelium dimigraforme]